MPFSHLCRNIRCDEPLYRCRGGSIGSKRIYCRQVLGVVFSHLSGALAIALVQWRNFSFASERRKRLRPAALLIATASVSAGDGRRGRFAVAKKATAETPSAQLVSSHVLISCCWRLAFSLFSLTADSRSMVMRSLLRLVGGFDRRYDGDVMLVMVRWRRCVEVLASKAWKSLRQSMTTSLLITATCRQREYRR